MRGDLWCRPARPSSSPEAAGGPGTVRGVSAVSGPVGTWSPARKSPALGDYKSEPRIGNPQLRKAAYGRFRAVGASRTTVAVASLITSVYGSDSAPDSIAAFNRATAEVRRL